LRAVARWPQTVIVVVLLGATAAAFAVAERLKLERSPITGTQVDKVFSPVCECPRDVAVISFVMRRADSVSVDILDSGRRSIRRLVRDREEAKGRVSYVWDGRDDAERVVAEGAYRPRVLLERNGRTIVLPNPIRVDTTPPRIRVASLRPRVLSPDGDGRRDRAVARYVVSEPARAMLLVDGRRRVLAKFHAVEGRLVWYGRVGGRPLRPGTYEVRLRAFDRAGNRSARTRAISIRVRFVELARDELEVVAGRRFSVRVSTDVVRYRWLFAGERGSETRRVLVLRAPEEPGEYTLYAVAGRYADRARVVVTEPPPPE
jgi:hypothetical protein